MRIYDGDGVELVSIERLAEATNCSPTTLHAYRSRGYLPAPAGQVGRTLLWRLPDTIAWASTRRADAVPLELRLLDRWVLWRTETRNGKATKIPYRASHPTRKASSTDPATWASYSDAVTSVGRAHGVGFVLNGDGIAGVDLDHCITDGQVAGWADELLALAPDCYTEVSPSGAGLRVFGHATIDHGRNVRLAGKAGVEWYGTGRYLTVTGDRWQDRPSSLGDISALVDAATTM